MRVFPVVSSNETWWKLWAPYWERLEDRHLSTLVADRLPDGTEGPALVVGAGQGLIVERLRQRGIVAFGMDMEPAMIAMAKKRRGIDLIQADASSLPFRNESFRTVIVATGVVDYLADEGLIGRIVDEAARVTCERGELILTFYKLPRRIERIQKALGVLTPDGRFRMRRIFEIMKAFNKSSAEVIKLIASWTGQSLLRTGAYWSYLGITLPKSMREEGRLIGAIFKQAEADGKSMEELVACVPESLPYRTEADVFALVEKVGIHTYAAFSGQDCTVIRHHRFSRLPMKRRVNSARAVGEDFVIRTDRLTKAFAKGCLPAVDGLNISVKRGTVFGILGPNGAGKTTTLSMLCGLVEPTRGQIVFSDGLNKKNIREAIGYVPQKLALYERLSARENLRFFAGLHGIVGERFKERSEFVLDMVGLSARAKEPISHFSGGMLRRLNLAAGLIHEPKIILLDEPTVGIDPQSRNRIFDAVLDLKRKGATVLYTTHYMEEAMSLCDTIAIIDHGRVVLEDSPSAALAEYGLSEIQLIVSGPTNPEVGRHLGGLPGVATVSFDAPILTIRARPSDAGADIIRAIERVFDETCGPISGERKPTLTLKCFVEPTLEKLFLDITGRTLRDERERT
jgi:ABC-2 type transport system ATP-binding protein